MASVSVGRNPVPAVLVLCTGYLPGFLSGGPVRSIASLVDEPEIDVEWLIICPDRDLGASAAYPGILADQWCVVGRASVFYISKSVCRPWSILKILSKTPHDLLYVNSFFSPWFSVLPIIARWLGFIKRKPLIIAPRGEFSSAALSIKSCKKKLFISAARFLGIHGGAFWHCSTSHELADLTRIMAVPKDACFVAADLVSHRHPRSEFTKLTEDEVLKVAFLSRLSPIKNLEFALAVLAEVTFRVQFNIYGPEEDVTYASACRALAAELPPNVRATFHGPVSPDAVVDVLAQNDVFLLPTRGENFGHVIVEAWQAGLPVLISDQTPWRDLQQMGVGWDLPLVSPEPFARALEEVAAWSDEKRRDVAGVCRAKAMAILDDRDAVDANRRMFNAVLNAGV